MAARTQGDVKFFLTSDGVEMEIRGGQPIMEGGLGTAVILSLFTTEDWVGNHFQETLGRMGGEFEKVANGPITVTTLNKARDAAKRDLAWMLESGAAEDIKINVRAPSHDRLQVEIYITPPGGNVEKFQLAKFGENWISQARDKELSDGL